MKENKSTFGYASRNTYGFLFSCLVSLSIDGSVAVDDESVALKPKPSTDPDNDGIAKEVNESSKRTASLNLSNSSAI